MLRVICPSLHALYKGHIFKWSMPVMETHWRISFYFIGFHQTSWNSTLRKCLEPDGGLMIPTEMSSDLRQPFKTAYIKIYCSANIAEAEIYIHIWYTYIFDTQVLYIKQNMWRLIINPLNCLVSKCWIICIVIHYIIQ